jgi:hypothetical protein
LEYGENLLSGTLTMPLFALLRCRSSVSFVQAAEIDNVMEYITPNERKSAQFGGNKTKIEFLLLVLQYHAASCRLVAGMITA